MQILWPLDIFRITVVALELLRLSKLSLSHQSDTEKHTGARSWLVNLSRPWPQKWDLPLAAHPATILKKVLPNNYENT